MNNFTTSKNQNPKFAHLINQQILSTSPNKIKLAIFASGAGSNAQKIIDYFRNHPKIKVSLIVSTKDTAGVINIATKEDIPFIVIKKIEFQESGYVQYLKGHLIDWIILAGFLWKVPQALLNVYPDKIINIHPALLPSFGGKGMYGLNVHTAVIQSGEQQSGITIHFIDEKYDHGDIILQESLAIKKEETPESLANRIHELEHKFFAPTIEKVILSREIQTLPNIS